MPSPDLNRSLDSLYEDAEQLTHQITVQLGQNEFEPIDDLRTFAVKLTQSTAEVLMESFSRDHTSLETMKLFVENLIVLTRLLQQTTVETQDEVQYLNELQYWFRDEILELLLKQPVIEPHNPPPPPRLPPRRRKKVETHNPPPPPSDEEPS